MIFCFILCILSVNLRLVFIFSNIYIEVMLIKVSFVYIYSKRMRDFLWVFDKGNLLKICLLRIFNNYLVFLFDVIRE